MRKESLKCQRPRTQNSQSFTVPLPNLVWTRSRHITWGVLNPVLPASLTPVAAAASVMRELFDPFQNELFSHKTCNNGARGMQAGNRKSGLSLSLFTWSARTLLNLAPIDLVGGPYAAAHKNHSSVLVGLARCRCKMGEVRMCSFLKLSLVRLALLLWQVSLLVNYLRSEAGANCCLYVMESSVRVWLRLGPRLRMPFVCLLTVSFR